jgi:hypothetical protein
MDDISMLSSESGHNTGRPIRGVVIHDDHAEIKTCLLREGTSNRLRDCALAIADWDYNAGADWEVIWGCGRIIE